MRPISSISMVVAQEGPFDVFHAFRSPTSDCFPCPTFKSDDRRLEAAVTMPRFISSQFCCCVSDTPDQGCLLSLYSVRSQRQHSCSNNRPTDLGASRALP